MKKVLKFKTVCTLIFVFTLLLSACNGANMGGTTTQPTTVPDTTTNEKEQINLVLWGAIQKENGPEDAFKEFEANNPGIKIEYVYYVNDEQGNLKLDTSLMAGEDIDLYYSYANDTIIKRVESGYAEDLTPWLEKANFSMQENYGEGYLTYKDKIYSIPTAREFQFIYINKSMFDKAGIPVPKEWSIDEYREITKKLTTTEGGKKIYGGCWPWVLAPICKSAMHVPLLGLDSFYNNEGLSNFDHPVFKDSLNLMVDLMINDKSHMNMIEFESSKLTPYGELLNGKAATVASGSWLIRYIKNVADYPHDFVVAAAPFPTLEKGKPDYVWQGYNNNIMMNKNSAKKEAAFEYIKYMATEGQLNYAKAGKPASWIKVSKETAIKGLLGENPGKLFDVESFEWVLFNRPVKLTQNTKTVALPEIYNIWRQEIEKTLSGAQDVDTSLANAKRNADKAITDASK